MHSIIRFRHSLSCSPFFPSLFSCSSSLSLPNSFSSQQPSSFSFSLSSLSSSHSSLRPISRIGPLSQPSLFSLSLSSSSSRKISTSLPDVEIQDPLEDLSSLPKLPRIGEIGKEREEAEIEKEREEAETKGEGGKKKERYQVADLQQFLKQDKVDPLWEDEKLKRNGGKKKKKISIWETIPKHWKSEFNLDPHQAESFMEKVKMFYNLGIEVRKLPKEMTLSFHQMSAIADMALRKKQFEFARSILSELVSPSLLTTPERRFIVSSLLFSLLQEWKMNKRKSSSLCLSLFHDTEEREEIFSLLLSPEEEEIQNFELAHHVMVSWGIDGQISPLSHLKKSFSFGSRGSLEASSFLLLGIYQQNEMKHDPKEAESIFIGAKKELIMAYPSVFLQEEEEEEEGKEMREQESKEEKKMIEEEVFLLYNLSSLYQHMGAILVKESASQQNVMDLWNEAVSVFSHPYWHEEEEERRERKERKKILLPLSSSFSSSSSSSSPSQKGRTKTGGKKTIPEKTKVSISRIFRGLITACYDYNWFLAEPLLSSLLSLRNIEIPRKAKYPVMKIGYLANNLDLAMEVWNNLDTEDKKTGKFHILMMGCSRLRRVATFLLVYHDFLKSVKEGKMENSDLLWSAVSSFVLNNPEHHLIEISMNDLISHLWKKKVESGERGMISSVLTPYMTLVLLSSSLMRDIDEAWEILQQIRGLKSAPDMPYPPDRIKNVLELAYRIFIRQISHTKRFADLEKLYEMAVEDEIMPSWSLAYEMLTQATESQNAKLVQLWGERALSLGANRLKVYNLLLYFYSFSNLPEGREIAEKALMNRQVPPNPLKTTLHKYFSVDQLYAVPMSWRKRRNREEVSVRKTEKREEEEEKEYDDDDDELEEEEEMLEDEEDSDMEDFWDFLEEEEEEKER